MAEVTTPAVKAETMRDYLNKNLPSLQAAFPAAMKTEGARFLRIAYTVMSRRPDLYECTPRSMFGALMICGQMGLEPDDTRGLAYLVPFANRKNNTKEVTLIPGYKGLIELATRSERVTFVIARVVYVKDIFQYQYGGGEGQKDWYIHQKTEELEPGALRFAYAKAVYPNGQEQIVVLNRREVMERKERSSAAKYPGTPWDTDEAAMWRKSAVRELATFLPSNAKEMHTMVGMEDKADAGIGQGLEDLAPPEEEPPASNLKDRVEKKRGRPPGAKAEPDKGPGPQPPDDDKVPEFNLDPLHSKDPQPNTELMLSMADFKNLIGGHD